MGAVAAELRDLGARPEPFGLIGVLAARVPSGAAAVAALRDDPRVAYIERDPTLRAAADEFDSVDPSTGIKFTWAYDAVHAGEAIAAVNGGSSRTVAVLDTGVDVTTRISPGRSSGRSTPPPGPRTSRTSWATAPSSPG